MKTQQTPNTDHDIGYTETPYPAAPAQAQHSPLPWRSEWKENDAEHRILAPIQGNGFSEIIAQVIRTDNAAFIVRACNNVQRLADALAWVIGDDTTDEPAIVDAREALAEWSKSI